MNPTSRRQFLVALLALIGSACAKAASTVGLGSTTTTATPRSLTDPGPVSPALSTPAAADPPTTTTTSTPATTTTTTPTTTTTAQGDAVTIGIAGRAAWGARDAVVDRMLRHSDGLRFLTVHHAGDNESTTGPARFRAWQTWHMDGRSWGDVAYHFIIGVDGTLYRGRDVEYRGDTGTNYDPDGHFLVVVEGNFDKTDPTSPQLESLDRILAWAAAAYGIPPATIAGHRDYAATSCPGAGLYPYVSSGALQANVEALLAAGGVVVG